MTIKLEEIFPCVRETIIVSDTGNGHPNGKRKVLTQQIPFDKEGTVGRILYIVEIGHIKIHTTGSITKAIALFNEESI